MIIAGLSILFTFPVHGKSNNWTKDSIKNSSDPIITVTNETELALVASSGNGSSINPYIIENKDINASGESVGISINGTTSCVVIQNCTVYDSSDNGILIGSDNVNVSKNIIYHNNGYGIKVSGTNETISKNNASDNNFGIEASGTNLTITRNNASANNYGIVASGTNVIVVHNNATPNKFDGITVSGTNMNISNNDASKTNFGIHVSGTNLFVSANNASEGGYGLSISGTNVTATGNTISWNNVVGFQLSGNNLNVTGNTAYKNGNYGISVSGAFAVINNNTATANSQGSNGILVSCANSSITGNHLINNTLAIQSFNNTISGNIFNNSGLDITAFPPGIQYFKSQIMDTTNKVNGKPLYYFVGRNNLQPVDFTNAGQVIVAYCNNSLISGLSISKTSNGIVIFASQDDVITGNDVKNCSNTGIYLDPAYGSNRNNTVSANTISSINGSGFGILAIGGGIITGNTINSSTFGILATGSNFTVNGNTIHHNAFGIAFFDYFPDTGINSLIVHGNNVSYNTVLGIQGAGIHAGINSIDISANTISHNTGNGIEFSGFLGINAITVNNNTVLSNNGTGIHIIGNPAANNNIILTGNNASFNKQAGFEINNSVVPGYEGNITALNNVATHDGTAGYVFLGYNNLYMDHCQAAFNTHDGIDIGGSPCINFTLANVNASSNGGYGLYARGYHSTSIEYPPADFVRDSIFVDNKAFAYVDIDGYIIFVNNTLIRNTLPLISHPSNIVYAYNSLGNMITWTVTDSTTSGTTYIVYKNGTAWSTGTWSSGLPVLVGIDGLPVGKYNITITASDGLGGKASSTVIVTVSNTPPSISIPSNIAYEQGTTGNMITWTVTDSTTSGTTYIIYKNSTAWSTGTWSSGLPVIVGIDGLLAGKYNITITASDGLGGKASSTVIVTVSNPGNTSPVNIAYSPGMTPNTITWTVTDSTSENFTYTVFKDGTVWSSGSWVVGIPVVVYINGVAPGTYNFTIVVNTGFGQIARNTETVIITAPGADSGIITLYILAIAALVLAAIVLIKSFIKMPRRQQVLDRDDQAAKFTTKK